MKRNVIVILVVATTMFGFSANAQRFGATPQDSIDCVVSINAYNNEYKNKNYKEAIVEWRKALQNCPQKASANLYVHGRTMMRYFIDKTTDPTLRNARIDTLLMLYDRQMANFRVDKVDMLFRKADDIEGYKPNDTKAMYEAYSAAVNADKKKVNIHAVARVMMIARGWYENKEITADKFTQVYTEMIDVAELQCAANPADTVRDQYRLAIESAFLTTDAADCENLLKVLTPRFNESKDDISVVKSTVALLSAKECAENELYYEAVEAYNKLDPSPKASYGLARMYYAKDDKAKAAEYFKLATETETDNNQKSTYFQEFGGLALKEGNISQAISYARQSIAANPRNGRAYLLLGTAYATIKGCGEDEVSKRAIFWVAVDQLQRAKQLDSNLSSDANKYINMYSQHFPTQADAFYLNLLDGDKYQVNCGAVNETTTVRTRK
jgi:tetratricopeptide (TPR) repeat protein